MSKIIILLLTILLLGSCNLQQEPEWTGHYRVRLSVSGTSDTADITIKYQDEISGLQIIELNDCTLPFEYSLTTYRGFGEKRVFVYIKADNTDSVGDLKTLIEYDRAKDGQYVIATRCDYHIERLSALSYAYLK